MSGLVTLASWSQWVISLRASPGEEVWWLIAVSDSLSDHWSGDRTIIHDSVGIQCCLVSDTLCMSIAIAGKCQWTSSECSAADTGALNLKWRCSIGRFTKCFISKNANRQSTVVQGVWPLSVLLLCWFVCVCVCVGGVLNDWVSEEQAVLTSVAASVDVFSRVPFLLTLSPSSGCWTDLCHRLTHYSSSFCTLTCAPSAVLYVLWGESICSFISYQ